ncbi:MAG: glutathione S-transferase family protein [Pseudomonadota bacterium]
MSATLTLISHRLCPYVQRAAIVLFEKGVDFKRVDIDLANKPEWFLKISPLGKTPVLLVDDQAIFESAVICEFLDESFGAQLHPENALERAQHRSWMEFSSATLNAISAFYRAPDEETLRIKANDLQEKFEQLEKIIKAHPYFAGTHFSLVDAAFAPVFRYFKTFEQGGDFGFFTNTPKVSAWRDALEARCSVRNAAPSDYDESLRAFLIERHSALSVRMKLGEFVEPQEVTDERTI